MNQYQIDSYFLLAKSRNKEIAENINDFMFMYKKENELYFTNENGNDIQITSNNTENAFKNLSPPRAPGKENAFRQPASGGRFF